MMRGLAVAAILAFPAGAQELAPETSAEPVARPDGAAAPSGTTAGQDAAREAPAPAETEAPPAAPEPEAPPIRETMALGEVELAACLAALDALEVTYTQSDPIIADEDRDCGILQPVTVTEIAPGIAVEPPATLRCPTARGLAEWAQDFVEPAAERLDRGRVTTIENGTGYYCRRRNNQPDGRLSEHAFGNAFDLMGFRFSAGDPIAIEPRARQGTIEESFQDAVRASACMEFTTVLGPGSDEFHDDHLHLDIAARESGFRLCEQGQGEGDGD